MIQRSDWCRHFSVVPGSATLFAVQGWDIQTWGGHSPAELLNKKLFTRFSLAGLFFPVMAFSLWASVDSAKIEEELLQKLKRDIVQELVMQNSAIPAELSAQAPVLRKSPQGH